MTQGTTQGRSSHVSRYIAKTKEARVEAVLLQEAAGPLAKDTRAPLLLLLPSAAWFCAQKPVSTKLKVVLLVTSFKQLG